jgi:hypothetical protein
MKASKLVFENVAGAGQQIKAHLGEPVECVEFRLRGDVAQPVLIGYSPFIQFADPKWSAMLDETFQQMVDAWNEKHSNNSGQSRREAAYSAPLGSPLDSPK